MNLVTKMDLPKRKSTRLKNYDYSQNGYYFITICTHKKQKLLCNIVGEGLAPPEIVLSKYEKIINTQLLDLEKRYSCIKVDKFVIMPNHIHIILVIQNSGGASPSPTISDIICTLKSLTTRMSGLNPFWQRSFHDHIICSEQDYLKIWNYIDTNPQKWSEDCFYIEQKKRDKRACFV